MPRFTYTARDAAGKPVKAALEAPTRRDVLRKLSARGLQPIRVTEEKLVAKPKAEKPRPNRPEPGTRSPRGKAARAAKTAESQGGGIWAALTKKRGNLKFGRKDRLPFLEALEDLTSSGLSAGEAIRLLALRMQEPRLKALCRGIWDMLSEGRPLSQAMESYPEVFDDSTLSLVQAGEATGNLNATLARIIEHLRSGKELQRKLTAALAYPLFLMFVAGAVVLFFLFFLLPRLQTLFNSLRGELPFATKILIGLANFSIHYGLFVVVGFVVLAVGFWRWRATEPGRLTTDGWAIKMPLLGPFVVSQTVLAFSQTLSVLLENGITTVEALRMTERQVHNRVHRAAFREATGRIMEGEGLSVALTRTDCFPGLVLDQLAVSENTGNVVPGLKKVATSYQKQISDQLSFFTSILGSGVLLCVFLFVGFIAYAIVSAVFELSSSFQN